MNTFLKEALRLADLGFKVLPLRPGDKRPAVEHGVHDASNDPEVITKWWTAMPNANLGISCEGLLVVDIDNLKTNWPGSDERANDLSTCPLQKTPRGGHHRVMRLPPGKTFGNTTSKLAERVDTRGLGGYVLVSPSVIGPDRYEWLQPIESWNDIPLVFDWLSAELEHIQATGGYNGTGDEFLGNRPIVKGEQNDTLTRIGGWLRLHGFSEGQIEAMLLKVSVDRCVDSEGHSRPHSPERIAKIAWSVSRYEPDIFRVAAMEDTPPEPAADDYPDPGRFPPHLLDSAGGLIAEIIDYTLRTQQRPQPIFALGGAIALMSVLTGRKITDDENLRTNVLCLNVGRSGSGKDRSRQVNREILDLIGADALLGSEEIQSGNGVYTTARTKPAHLLQLDELGRMLKRIKESKSDALANVASTIMKLYSSAGGPCMLGGYADDKRNFMLQQPHCVVLGTSTLEHLCASMSTDELNDGFLSRTLLFHSSDFPMEKRAPREPVPDVILQKAKAWWNFEPTKGDLASLNPTPKVVTYTGDALERIGEFRIFCDKLGADHTLWTRASEKAKKLAMIHKASLEGPPMMTVGLKALDWACQVVEHDTRMMLWLASQWIADSTLEGHCKRVVRWIRKCKVASLNKFTRANQQISKKTREEILETLVQSGQLIVEKAGKSTTIRRC